MNKQPFDISSHLKTEEDIKFFLQEVADTGTASDFIHAVGIVAKARGMTDVSKRVGVSRSSLYKSLSEQGNPNFTTVYDTIKACGLKMAIA